MDLKEIERQIDNNNKDLDRLKDERRSLQTHQRSLTQRLRDHENDVKSAQRVLDQRTAKRDETKERLHKTEEEIKRIDNEIKDYGVALEGLQRNLKRITDELARSA